MPDVHFLELRQKLGKKDFDEKLAKAFETLEKARS
jgi:hypothetical protein